MQVFGCTAGKQIRDSDEHQKTAKEAMPLAPMYFQIFIILSCYKFVERYLTPKYFA